MNLQSWHHDSISQAGCELLEMFHVIRIHPVSSLLVILIHICAAPWHLVKIGANSLSDQKLRTRHSASGVFCTNLQLISHHQDARSHGDLHLHLLGVTLDWILAVLQVHQEDHHNRVEVAVQKDLVVQVDVAIPFRSNLLSVEVVPLVVGKLDACHCAYPEVVPLDDRDLLLLVVGEVCHACVILVLRTVH